MKSGDYKRGVRDMAAAMREDLAKEGYSEEGAANTMVNDAEQRLLAEPVPKFAVGPTDEIRLAALEKAVQSWALTVSECIAARVELRLVLEVLRAAEHLVMMELKPERSDWEPLEKALAALRSVR